MLKRFLTFVICTAMLLTLMPFTSVSVAAEEERRLYGFDFSDEATQGQLFSPTDAISIQWVKGTGVGHDDDAVLKTVHKPGEVYTSSSNAVMLDLPEPLPAGGVYRIVAWVYASTDENPNKDILTGPGFVLNGDYSGGQGEVKFPSDFGTLPLDEWKLIDVTLPLQELPVSRLDFRIVINDEAKHPDVWYWDNIEIYQIGGLEEVSATPGESVTELGYPLITRTKLGTHDGVDYELWNERKDDPVSMTLTGGGTFQCEWDAQNILFRMGKRLGSVMTYEEYGNITMEYAAEYTIKSGDVSYLCMYGWTEDPMYEFYIIESHGSYKPPGGVGYKGTYELDRGTYEVYVNTRVEQPSIQGTKTFDQYFAVRTSKRTEGTLSISEHFKKWEELGLDMSGVIYDIALCVEGYRSSGSANVYSHVLTIGDDVYGTPIETAVDLSETAETEEAAGTEEAAETEEAVDANENAEADKAEEADQPVESDAAEAQEGGASNIGIIIAVVAVIVIVGAVAIMLLRKTSKK